MHFNIILYWLLHYNWNQTQWSLWYQQYCSGIFSENIFLFFIFEHESGTKYLWTWGSTSNYECESWFHYFSNVPLLHLLLRSPLRGEVQESGVIQELRNKCKLSLDIDIYWSIHKPLLKIVFPNHWYIDFKCIRTIHF
jgi:hypothetical protein